MSIDLKEIIGGNYSEKEIRAAFLSIASVDLEKHLEAFICSQDTVCKSVKMWARKLALRVNPECLTSEHLKMFIRYQESNDEDVRWLGIDLAHNILEEVIMENFPYLIDCQESDDEDVRSLTGDLVLGIDPDKLTDRLDFLKKRKEESKNQFVCDLTSKLIENIQAPLREEKVSEIIDFINRY